MIEVASAPPVGVKAANLKFGGFEGFGDGRFDR
jgi:hypothetical protein